MTVHLEIVVVVWGLVDLTGREHEESLRLAEEKRREVDSVAEAEPYQESDRR